MNLWLQSCQFPDRENTKAQAVGKTKYAGFRLKTDNPKLSGLARGENEWYSKEQFQAIQDVAKANALTILPEFDSPAHSLAFVGFRLLFVFGPNTAFILPFTLNRFNSILILALTLYLIIRS